MRRRHVLTVLAALLLLGGVAAAQPAPPEPYVDPPFADACEFHRYDEGEAPPLDDLPDDDPFCVEYQKRDITVSTGAAAAFLLAEPARVAAGVPKCQYWQVDFWSVQLAPDTTPVVAWDGSYWFDKDAGTGAVRMQNFAVGGQPASPHEVADVVEPLSPDLADGLREYGDETGGGGMSFDLGGGDPSCQGAGPEEPDPDPEPDENGAEGDEGEDAEPAPSQDSGARLPATGGSWLAAGILLALAAAALRR